MFDLFEPAGEDEEGAHNVTVTEDMSPDDVLNRVMEVISKVWEMALVKWSTMPRKSDIKVIGWMDFIMAKDNIGKIIFYF